MADGAMLASIFLTILVAQAEPMTTPPASQATAPPTIIEVHSKNRLCSALEHSIGPSIAGLMQDDSAIMHGLSMLGVVKSHNRALSMDIADVGLENDVSAIVRNLGMVDHLLQPSSPDIDPAYAETIETMKKALRDVAQAQLMSLNLLDGALETRQLGEMWNLSDIPNFALPEGTHAAMDTALKHAPDGVAEPGPKFPAVSRLLMPGDLFPEIRQSEDRANHIIVATAASCTPVNHPLSVEKP